jgi:hypothetical protein
VEELERISRRKLKTREELVVRRKSCRRDDCCFKMRRRGRWKRRREV